MATRLDARLTRLERSTRHHRSGPEYEIWEPDDDDPARYRNAITGEIVQRSDLAGRPARQIVVNYLPPRDDNCSLA
jgi:hypothetical protein